MEQPHRSPDSSSPGTARPPGVGGEGAPGDHAAMVAARISRDFGTGRLDLAMRPGAPTPRWEAMPEYETAQHCLAADADMGELRLALTLVAALDRARDADRLWANAARLFETARWAFHPRAVLQRPLSDLRDVLAGGGVSQRHVQDAAAWRLIHEAILDPGCPPTVQRAILDGLGDARELLRDVAATRPSHQPWFPYLAGPKVSVMWVRMLAWPGGAEIEHLDVLPVAVDVQVRKVTEYLGVTRTEGMTLEAARLVIQAAWRAAAGSAAGPSKIAATGAALDPALRFFGKWGCTHCERSGRRVPISAVCRACRFEGAARRAAEAGER